MNFALLFKPRRNKNNLSFVISAFSPIFRVYGSQEDCSEFRL